LGHFSKKAGGVRAFLEGKGKENEKVLALNQTKLLAGKFWIITKLGYGRGGARVRKKNDSGLLLGVHRAMEQDKLLKRGKSKIEV